MESLESHSTFLLRYVTIKKINRFHYKQLSLELTTFSNQIHYPLQSGKTRYSVDISGDNNKKPFRQKKNHRHERRRSILSMVIENTIVLRFSNEKVYLSVATGMELIEMNTMKDNSNI